MNNILDLPSHKQAEIWYEWFYDDDQPERLSERTSKEEAIV